MFLFDHVIGTATTKDTGCGGRPWRFFKPHHWTHTHAYVHSPPQVEKKSHGRNEIYQFEFKK